MRTRKRLGDLLVQAGLVTSEQLDKALKDKGITEFLKGSKAAALVDLEAAIEKDPRLLSAYITAGMLLEQSDRKEKALALYELALKEPQQEGDASLRQKLQNDRNRLKKTLDNP